MGSVIRDNIVGVEHWHSVDIQELNQMDSDLYNAVINDEISALQEMESRLIITVDKQLTCTKNTVLHLACQYGSFKCVDHILKRYKSIMLLINSSGETALHLAARQGDERVVEALLEAAKSSPTQTTSLSVIQFLIRVTDVERETALHVAVRYKHKNVVQLLLDADPSHEYPRNKYGETPLYLASIGCYKDLVKTILEISQFPTFGGPDERTALHGALLDKAGHDCVKILLEKNRDLIKKTDSYGWTAFHYVANNNLHAIVEDLVLADKSVGYLADRYHNKTPLHVAAYQGHEDVMKILWKYYPDSWDILDGNGQNILHIAVEQDKKEMIKFILSQDCKEVNKLMIRRNNQGNTPLHLIAKLGCYVPDLLNLKAECDWEVLNSQGQTPWDVLQSEQSNISKTDHIIIRVVRQMQAKSKRQYLPLQDIELDYVEKDPEKLADMEKDPEKQKPQKQVKEEMELQYLERTEKTINTHIIVAALIATVALTAGFALPGGSEQEGKNKGSPVLLKHVAFKTFIITDATALLLSISSLFLYFWTILIKDRVISMTQTFFWASTLLNLCSIIAMMLAFVAGTYAVLANLPVLAITVCSISSFFFLFIFYVIYEIYQKLF